jgi:hypothetical protein
MSEDIPVKSFLHISSCDTCVSGDQQASKCCDVTDRTASSIEYRLLVLKSCASTVVPVLREVLESTDTSKMVLVAWYKYSAERIESVLYSSIQHYR